MSLPPNFGTPSKTGQGFSPFQVATLTPDLSNNDFRPWMDSLHLIEPAVDSDGYPQTSSNGGLLPAPDNKKTKSGKAIPRVGGVHMNFVRHLFGGARHGFSDDNVIVLVNKTGEKLEAGDQLIIPEKGDKSGTEHWNEDFDLPNGIKPQKGFFLDPTLVTVMVNTPDEKERPVACHLSGPVWAKAYRKDGSEMVAGDKLGTDRDEPKLCAAKGGGSVVLAVDPEESDKALVWHHHNVLVSDTETTNFDRNESTYIADRNKAVKAAPIYKLFKVFNRSLKTGPNERMMDYQEVGFNLTPDAGWPDQVGESAATGSSGSLYGSLLVNIVDSTFGCLSHVLEVVDQNTANINTQTKYKDVNKKGDDVNFIKYNVAAIRHDAQFRYGLQHGRLFFVNADPEGDDGETTYGVPITGEFRRSVDKKGIATTFIDEDGLPAETCQWVPYILIPATETEGVPAEG